jgi:uncharacterized protein YjbI with pentapeptide repeats
MLEVDAPKWVPILSGTGTGTAGSDLAVSDLASSGLAGSDLAATDLAVSDLAGSGLAGSGLAATDLAGSDLAASDLGASDLGASDIGVTDLAASDIGDDLAASDFAVRDDTRLTVQELGEVIVGLCMFSAFPEETFLNETLRAAALGLLIELCSHTGSDVVGVSEFSIDSGASSRKWSLDDVEADQVML